MTSAPHSVLGLLKRYQPLDDGESADVARVRELAGTAGDPWARSAPLHLTASALIVHPPSGRVLLRWHTRQRAWLQVGGHADPGEDDALAITLREAREETGLADLVAWPDEKLRHVAIVSVVAGKGEPAHEHADLRFFLATGTPESATAETPQAPLRWLAAGQAHEETSNVSLRETLARVRPLLGA